MNYIFFQRIINITFRIFWKIFCKRSFKYWGKGADILFPLQINNPQFMTISEQVKIRYKAWLFCLKIDTHTPDLYFGTGSYIGNYSHIVCVRKIHIGDKVLIADRVYISDNIHAYVDISTPIIDQPVQFKGEVTIGQGSWIGENVCIIGARIGRNCIIGANSVVTKDIPDYCIAVGSPARVLKKYNPDSGKWEKTYIQKE